MKRNIYYIGFIFCLSCFISCSSSKYYITIETQQPAEITLPLEEDEIMVVNNSVSQPQNYGIELYINEKKSNNPYSFEFDSVTWICTNYLAQHFDESKFFSKVYVCKKNPREDNQWLNIEELPEKFRVELEKQVGTSTIITIDRIIYKLSQKVYPRYSNDSDPYTFINITTDISCSIYLPNREKAFTTFSIIDSLKFSNLVLNDSSILYKELPLELINNHLAFDVCKKVSERITPTWEAADRIIYSGQNSRMREANAYFKKNNMDDAISLWKIIYDEEKKSEEKAKMAINIAVAYELQDELEIALDWAKKSNSDFKQSNSSKAIEEQEYAKSYVDTLEKRIKNNKILDTQFGIE